MPKETIFVNLEVELARAHLSKTELARRIKMTPCTMSGKINGKTQFTLKEMRAIRDELERVNGIAYALDYLFLI